MGTLFGPDSPRRILTLTSCRALAMHSGLLPVYVLSVPCTPHSRPPHSSISQHRAPREPNPSSAQPSPFHKRSGHAVHGIEVREAGVSQDRKPCVAKRQKVFMLRKMRSRAGGSPPGGRGARNETEKGRECTREKKAWTYLRCQNVCGTRPPCCLAGLQFRPRRGPIVKEEHQHA